MTAETYAVYSNKCFMELLGYWDEFFYKLDQAVIRAAAWDEGCQTGVYEDKRG